MEPNNSFDHRLPPVDNAGAPTAPLSGVPTAGPTGMSNPTNPAQVASAQMTQQMLMQQQIVSGMAMSGMEAGDVELIEKAWVEKAKAIVHGTRGNPYLQSKELSKVKAEYIKKRYSKDIKVAE